MLEQPSSEVLGRPVYGHPEEEGRIAAGEPKPLPTQHGKQGFALSTVDVAYCIDVPLV